MSRRPFQRSEAAACSIGLVLSLMLVPLGTAHGFGSVGMVTVGAWLPNSWWAANNLGWFTRLLIPLAALAAASVAFIRHDVRRTLVFRVAAAALLTCWGRLLIAEPPSDWTLTLGTSALFLAIVVVGSWRASELQPEARMLPPGRVLSGFLALNVLVCSALAADQLLIAFHLLKPGSHYDGGARGWGTPLVTSIVAGLLLVAPWTQARYGPRAPLMAAGAGVAVSVATILAASAYLGAMAVLFKGLRMFSPCA